MANITYNNIGSPSNMVTFTGVPNILKVEEFISGSKAVFSFTFNGNLINTVTADTQYYVTFLSETVSNVMNPRNARNKRFYISSDTSSTAMSFARAMRNCSSISADFNVIHSGSTVTLVAKTIGVKWSDKADYFERNIPSEYLTAGGTDGSAFSDLFNSQIDVDIYSGSTPVDGDYVTTLEKNFYGEECAFDVSPVLATFSEFGKTTPYCFNISVIKDNGEWKPYGGIVGYTTFGYIANQSKKYLTASGAQLLINRERGKNGTTLYTYSNEIPYSVLCGLDTSGWNLVISVKDSANNEIYNSGIITQRRTSSSNLIVDNVITVPQDKFSLGYYVDLTIGSESVRFNIIKPLKATEYFQRVEWRNEYGGISFFDFTGSRSENDSVEIETYEKNVFDYHESDDFERKMIYRNEFRKEVTLNSHLIDEDGKWVFNSLMKSKKVWTMVNGYKYYIIPESIEVSEEQNYNNIYTAKLVYSYSDNN